MLISTKRRLCFPNAASLSEGPVASLCSSYIKLRWLNQRQDYPATQIHYTCSKTHLTENVFPLTTALTLEHTACVQYNTRLQLHTSLEANTGKNCNSGMAVKILR